MPRRVFFSFHYDDVLRANVVRNSDIVSRQYERAARFHDKSLWEEAKKQGDLAIKRMINGALEGSSVMHLDSLPRRDLIDTKSLCDSLHLLLG